MLAKHGPRQRDSALPTAAQERLQRNWVVGSAPRMLQGWQRGSITHRVIAELLPEWQAAPLRP